jgi:hypothetical protein
LIEFGCLGIVLCERDERVRLDQIGPIFHFVVSGLKSNYIDFFSY